MIIKLKDPNQRLHGKLHKRDPYYFRHHYGEQRLVYIPKPYIDHPTEKQKASREAFKTLRQEVARQLHDPKLKARWEARFKKDPQGYKMLHTYVYAKLKAGVTVTQSPTYRGKLVARLPISHEGKKQSHAPFRGLGGFVVYSGTILPLFLPWKIPKQEHFADCRKSTTFVGTNVER